MFETFELNIHFINGIDGALLEKKITVNHIGCTMSHLKAWDYVLENNIYNFLIVEDDVVLKKILKKTNEYLKNLPVTGILFILDIFSLAQKDKNNYLIEKYFFHYLKTRIK